MSYPYSQYPGENFSNPTTPSLDPFPTWETVEHEEQQQTQQHQPAQQQQMQQPQSELPSPTGVHPPTPQQYQTIQLEEPTHIVPSQPRPAHDDTPVRLHHVHTRSERRRESLRESESRLLHLDVDTSRPSTAPGSTMAIRHGRSQPHQQNPIYGMGRSPSTAPGPPRQQQHGVRFASVQPLPQPSSSSMPSPAVPSPASGSSRIASYGSVIGSPDTSVVPQFSRPEMSARRRRFILRTDMNYDPETKILTAMLEVPGVKKADVRVTLSTCHYNRVKQITVSGHSTPVFPPVSDGGETTTVRERLFGEFSRTFAVPSEIKREDIDASMEDGVLTIKFPCGMPVHPNPEDVLVR
ncbi:Heat shock protein 16 [Hypsizygus marmoreus]|uniref:Heat shock protein 16 n=1 Tax=Hypsizygus marmoreus TaxID=39966 RepID=A0A369KCP6_HYPMA|nr:Heat shock protein 16 [Hypsizygus marmoreus]